MTFNKEKIIDFLWFLTPILLIFFIFIKPIFEPGLIVGSDWTFPYSNAQLKEFSDNGNNLWGFREIPTGSQIAHNNIYLFQLFAGIFANLGFSGEVFQKVFTAGVLLLTYTSSFLLFNKITHNKKASIIGSIFYLFSPIVFNYFNMGWIFVFLFMAIMPIFMILWEKFIVEKSIGSLLGLSALSAIAFLQAQSIFWLPILAFVITLISIHKIGIKKTILRFFIGIFVMTTIIFAVHASWFIPVSLNSEKFISATTNANDIFRFNTVNSLPYQLRGWGSLYNQHFELSFNSRLIFFSYVPILSILLLIVQKRHKKNNQKFIMLSLLLILISPFLFIFKYPLASLPLSNIVRDNSRFIIFTVLGLSLGISIFYSTLKNNFVKMIFIAMLAILIHPYLQGRLTKPAKFEYGYSEFSKDQRIRHLIASIDKNEEIISKYDGVNILSPTSGFVKSVNDNRFQVTFSDIADFQAFFSPYASGVYISDKSNPVMVQFIKKYFELANNDLESFNNFARIYGIGNIFLRPGLTSNYPNSPDANWEPKNCVDTGNTSSDWSIAKICPIKNSYPKIFASENPIITTSEDFYKYLKNLGDEKGYLVSIDCQDKINQDSDFCVNQKLQQNEILSPELSFEDLGFENYKVKVSNVSSGYILVLNQTYHPSWKIESTQSKALEFDHLRINQLVNGWYIKNNGQDAQEFIISFYPQQLFRKLLPFSITTLIITSILAVILIVMEKKKNNE